jgi:hypothetical protein
MPPGLRPLHERLLIRLRELPRLFADETTPGRGRTKTGQLWAYAADDHPWGGSDPPGVAYVYAPDRKAERPIAHLEGFKGILQVDGYAGYRKLAERRRPAGVLLGRTFGITSTNSPPPELRRLPAKRSNISPRSTPSKKTSVAAVPTSVVPSGSRKAGRSSTPSNRGCGQSSV